MNTVNTSDTFNNQELTRDVDGKLSDVVYQAGPFSSVNKTNTTKDKYLPGFLKSETVSEMWKPVLNTDISKDWNRELVIQ